MSTVGSVVVVLVLAACGGRPPPAQVAVTPTGDATLVVPTVSDARALARDDVRPPYLYLLGDAVQLAAAATWADLDRSDITVARRPSTPREIEAFVRQQFDAGTSPIGAVAAWARGVTAPPIDEPPPPEDEDGDHEDGRENEWSTITPEEGAMGTQDADRAEGRYKMKVDPPGPPRAARPSAQRNSYSGQLDPHGRPRRVAHVVGVTADVDQLVAMRSMIIAAPTVAASKLIELVRITEGSIAVAHAGTIRPLRLQFLVQDNGGYRRDKRWLEVRVQPTGPVVVEAVADKAIETLLEPASIAAAITKAHDARGIRGDVGLDVLVAPTVDAQRLVDVLAALEIAGVKEIGIGTLPSADELARRGRRISTLLFGRLQVNGSIAKDEMRAALHGQRSKLLACHARAPVSGDVELQFLVSPQGIVVAASTSPPSPISDCLKAIATSLRFPSHPAGTQVISRLELNH